VLAAIYTFPFDKTNMVEIAELRARELDRQQVDRHIHQVQAEFASEVEQHLLSSLADDGEDAAFLATVAAQCVAAATFTAVNAWMRGEHSDLAELARLTELGLAVVEKGLAASVRPRSKRQN
jgi:hypothetical protein